MTLRLTTSRYHSFSWSLGAPVAISLGFPSWAPFDTRLDHCDELKPYGLFGKGLSTEEFTHLYVKRLERIGVTRIATRLNRISYEHEGQTLVLLCWEDLSKKPCHRRTFADWWFHTTCHEVPEVEP